MAISKIETKAGFLNIYNHTMAQTGSIKDDGIIMATFSSDFILIEKDGFYITYDEIGNRLMAMSSNDGCFVSIQDNSYILKTNRGEVSFSKNCKITNELGRESSLFDAQLNKIKHFSKHPQMKPFVGKKYPLLDRKVLLIGESHYLPPNSSPELVNNWYGISANVLNNEELIWTNTSLIVNNTDFKNKSHVIYKNIHYSLINSGVPDGLLTISYINFFQRPASKTGGSIEPTKEDADMANSVLKQTINILNPDLIYFISSKAYRYFDKNLFDIEKTGHGPHPACRHWNIKSCKYTKPTHMANITGKESFEYFVKSNIVI